MEVNTFLHKGHEFSLLDHCSMHVKQKQCDYVRNEKAEEIQKRSEGVRNNGFDHRITRNEIKNLRMPTIPRISKENPCRWNKTLPHSLSYHPPPPCWTKTTMKPELSSRLRLVQFFSTPSCNSLGIYLEGSLSLSSLIPCCPGRKVRYQRLQTT